MPDRVRNGTPWCVSRRYGRARVALCVAAAAPGTRSSALAPPLLFRVSVRVGAEQSVRDFFHDFARRTAERLGSAWAFFVAITVVVVWACLGPHYGFSDTWQLVINTGTTIVTFLMVFLIQNTQNRDAAALHLKLDELLRGVKGARTHLVDLENLSEAELEELHDEFQRIHERAARREEKGANRFRRRRRSSRSRTRAVRTRRARGRTPIA